MVCRPIAFWWPTAQPPVAVPYLGRVDAADGAPWAVIGQNRSLVSHDEVFLAPPSRAACSFSPQHGRA